MNCGQKLLIASDLTVQSVVGYMLSVSSLTASGTTATLVSPAHGLSIGSVFNVPAAAGSPYAGDQTVATVPDVNTITYTLATAARGPAAISSIMAYDAGATVGGVLSDPSTSTTLGSFSSVYQTGSNGLYAGTILHSITALLVDCVEYQLTMTATASNGAVAVERYWMMATS